MSPVYERSYEPWEGERTSRWRRIVAIAGESLEATRRSRWLWLLLAATLVHVAIRGGVLYVSGQVDVAQGAPEALREQISFTEGFMADALAMQALWVLTFVLVLVASSALSRDLQAGALSFYFSKPITRPGYAVGKLVTPIAAGMAVTALPVLVLWVLGMAFTPDQLQPATATSMPWRILAAGFLFSAVASLVVVALSGLLRSSQMAAVAWIGLVFVSAGAAQLLFAATGETGTLLVDVFGAFDGAARSIMDTTATVSTSGAWAVTLGWALASVIGLAWVLHGEEVIR